MTNYNYTHEWIGQGTNFKSSSVDNIWYNSNDKTAVIDWNDNLYRYNNVTLDEVKAVLASYSVGTAANRLKLKHGPGTKLGSFWTTDFTKVVETPAPTKQHSLNTPTAVVASNTKTYTFRFDLNGVERTHTVAAVEMDEAIKLLEDGAKAIGSNIVVKEVLVKFV